MTIERRARALLSPLKVGARLDRLRTSAAPVGLVFVYHGVVPDAPEPTGILHEVTTSHLESHLDALQRGLIIVPLADLQRRVHERRFGQRIPVAITFDDDLPEHMATADLLAQRGVPATFFLSGREEQDRRSTWWERLAHVVAAEGCPTVVSGLRDLIDLEPPPVDGLGLAAAVQALPPVRKHLVDQRLLHLAGGDPPGAGLPAEDIHRLVAAGFEIGFHTCDHAVLPDLGPAELRHALTVGRERLAAATGKPVVNVAYPHGRQDATVRLAAATAGYAAGFTTTAAAVTPSSHAMAVPRLVAPQAPGSNVLAMAAAALGSRAGDRGRR